MLDILRLLGVLAAFAALGWGAVKFGDVVTEAVDPDSRRQLRKLVRIGVGVIAVLFGVLVAFVVLSATLWGTGCEPVLDPMSCSPED